MSVSLPFVVLLLACGAERPVDAASSGRDVKSRRILDGPVANGGRSDGRGRGQERRTNAGGVSPTNGIDMTDGDRGGHDLRHDQMQRRDEDYVHGLYNPRAGPCPGHSTLTGYRTLSDLRSDLADYFLSFDTASPTLSPTVTSMPTTRTKTPTETPSG